MAISVSVQMAINGGWKIRRPTETEIVELFVGKTMWHNKVKKNFSKVSNYPLMMEWLKDDEGALPDIEVWGEEKSVYYFSDLESWIEAKTKEAKLKGKGKAKGKAKEDDSDSERKTKKKKEAKKHQTRSKGRVE